LYEIGILCIFEPVETHVMTCIFSGEVFDYLVAHGRMKEKEARAKFRQVMMCVCYSCSGWVVSDVY